MKAALKRCRIITATILAVGLGSALALYLTVAEVPVDPLAEFEQSKKFSHELERMGGKAAVLANGFTTWCAGLWHGKTLACTIAVITVIIAAAYYFIATELVAEARHDSAPPE